MRQRSRPITDIYLKEKDINKLRKGYHVFKMAHKHMHCLIPSSLDRKTVRTIQKLRDKIKSLEKGRG